MEYRIAIVGPMDEILGFKGLGLQVFNAEKQEEVEEVLSELKKKTNSEDDGERYAIVFVLERFIKNMDQDKYKRLASGALPAIIPIPGHAGSSGFGETKIRRIVEKAIGSDIFGNN